jgi:acyl-CoA thioester hydrolase
MQELLKAYPVIVVQAVVWGEMDAYGHVNNAVYFRYFENARLAYFLALGWDVAQLPRGIGPILASTQARFRHALTFPDTIAIGARVVEVHADRFVLRHAIASEKLGKITTEGESVVVTFDYSLGQKVMVPEEIRRKVFEIEGRVGQVPGEPGQ